MVQKKAISFALIFILVITIFAGCKASTSVEQATVRMGVLKGPSSLGMLQIMEKSSLKEADNIYEFTLAGAPADLQTKLISGELDIAAVPTNLASVLYNKTDKKVSVIAVSTLGVLYLLTKDEEISSFKDLEGKTIYASGQGSTPEYALNYLIEQNGLNGKVNVEYKSEHTELAALIASGNANIAMLPQPFVTTVTLKDPSIKVALDLNDEWRKVSGNTELAMTCIVVRNEFLEANKGAVGKFLDEYKASTEFVNANVGEAAVLSEKYDIIPEAVAKIAIPKCNIVFFEGADIKASVNPLIEVLFAANPQSVGGAVPDDAFYYSR